MTTEKQIQDAGAKQREEPAKKTGTEWPHNPPLPPREIDPSGEGDALRSHAHPGDDTVFGANDQPRKERKTERKEARTENDAERSRTER